MSKTLHGLLTRIYDWGKKGLWQVQLVGLFRLSNHPRNGIAAVGDADGCLRMFKYPCQSANAAIFRKYAAHSGGPAQLRLRLRNKEPACLRPEAMTGARCSGFAWNQCQN